MLGRSVAGRLAEVAPEELWAPEVREVCASCDLVVCNLGLDEMPSLDTALRDFSRVAKRGGEVRCTLPLAGGGPVVTLSPREGLPA